MELLPILCLYRILFIHEANLSHYAPVGDIEIVDDEDEDEANFED